MARLDFDEQKVATVISKLKGARDLLSNVDSGISSGLSLILGARGANHVDTSSLSNGAATCDECIRDVDEMIEYVTKSAEAILQFNGDVDKIGVFERLAGTVDMIGTKIIEGFFTAGEQLIDGFASVLGWIGGLFGADKFQESIANFIAKDYVGDAFHDFYYNSDFGLLMTKASYMKEDGGFARLSKGIGTALGYVAITYVGGGLVGKATGFGTTASTQAAGWSAFKAGARTAMGSLALGMGEAAVGAMGGTMQAGLGIGMEYNQAFKKGIGNAALSAALAFGLNKLISFGVGKFKAYKASRAAGIVDDVAGKGTTGTKGAGSVGDVAGVADDSFHGGSGSSSPSGGPSGGSGSSSPSGGSSGGPSGGSGSSTPGGGSAGGSSGPSIKNSAFRDKTFTSLDDLVNDTSMIPEEKFKWLNDLYEGGKISKSLYRKGAKMFHPDLAQGAAAQATKNVTASESAAIPNPTGGNVKPTANASAAASNSKTLLLPEHAESVSSSMTGDLVPVKPGTTDLVPIQEVIYGAVPVEPTPVNPVPTDLVPVNPKTTDLVPIQEVLYGAVPVEPTPVVPVGPTPVVPLDKTIVIPHPPITDPGTIPVTVPPTLDTVPPTIAIVPPTTVPPTSVIDNVQPVYAPPSTEAPITQAPITQAPITQAPITQAPITEAPITQAPITEAPITEAPITEAPITAAPITEAPITEAPITEAPITAAPITEAPITSAPVPVTPQPSYDVAPMNEYAAIPDTMVGKKGIKDYAIPAVIGATAGAAGLAFATNRKKKYSAELLDDDDDDVDDDERI